MGDSGHWQRRSESTRRRVTYDEYVIAVALTLARRHRPIWSWRHWRRVCRCGADLPCRSRHLIPINRGHWPSQDGPQ
ncbi:hypothetical protein C7C45_06480 [Micromonospora arborensis]|uniref:Uncharacterized protein n=1 Tax=Micromonospora arborensis TaxID=2116518 RepID=A0A318NN48_9ACTN|nr:hypothetical protein C7C45_06480 [Micromonospora arborensis]